VHMLMTMLVLMPQSRRSLRTAMGRLLTSYRLILERPATTDESAAGFHLHVHSAPLLRLFGIDVGHPIQD
jgi:hypothetical protein